MTTPAKPIGFAKSALGDPSGAWDAGRILVALTVVCMLAIQAYDVIGNGREFKAQDIGIGIGAVLTGFAAYLYGKKQETTTP